MLLPADTRHATPQRAGDECSPGWGVTSKWKIPKVSVCELFSFTKACNHRPVLIFFLNVIKHVDIAPAEIQKWIQHQPGLDRNLQICQEIQKPGKRYSQCFFCVCDLIFGLDVLLLKQQPLFGRWNISVEPTCCIKFHRWISERDASVGKIAATLTDVTYCRHLHNLSRNALVENLQYFVVFFSWCYVLSGENTPCGISS